MNQDEDVPTRVTRGALRRRSVDQEATPQKPAGAAVSGTPKKTNSTSKRVTALNAIQESESVRPSTPIVGRNTRRRMSETIDTPTSLPNKLVQNLKEAESTSTTEPGRRSRNTSLTEENLNELNATYEGNSTTLTTRSRTPARLRASHEALASVGSPQPVTGVRRSTRRNSVTSDDGNSSVQSLPVTNSKLGPSVRTLKDDTIIEEDDRDDRAESVSSDTSTRQKRGQSALSTASLSAASPRSSPASPMLDIKAESTPPRGSKIPRVAITPLSLSKLSPRSKNVSFSEDSKRDDNQSSLPKTPTSRKEMFVVVEDLRTSELKGASPRVAASLNVPESEINVAESKNKSKLVNTSPKCENMDSGDQLLNETVMSASKDKMNKSTTSMVASKDNTNDSTASMVASKDKMNDSSASMIVVGNGECAEGTLTANDVSGIEVLESSVKDTTIITVMDANDTVKDISRTADQSLSEGNKLSTSWSQPVRRSAAKGIDEYSVRKQEEQERLEEEKETLQKASLDSSLKQRSPVTKQQSSELKEDEEDTPEEEEDEEEETRERDMFVDDEALEVEDYQSCDSIDSELRKEMAENEIPEQGEDLGSEDTEDELEDDEDDGNDSWLVSDGEEIELMEEDELLQSSNDDETPLAKDNSARSESKKPKKGTRRRRILESLEDSDEEKKASSPSKSPKQNTESIRRSATPVVGGENDNLTPTKKSDAYDSRDDTVKSVDKATPNVDHPSMETSGVGLEIETSRGVPTTPTVGTKTPTKVALNSPSPGSMKTIKESDDDKQAVSVAGEEQEAKDCSAAMIEDVDKKEESDHQKDEEAIDNSDISALSSSLSKSPKKPINSRKSLPANAANITEPQSVVAGARKSLPASAKLLTANEETAKTDANEMEDKLPESDKNNESAEDIIDLDENSEIEPASSSDKKNKAQNGSLAVEVTLDQPSNDASKTGRKSLPPVSLISAQFYIGAAKKRNAVSGGNTKAVTSTPKQPAKEMASTGNNKEDKNTPVANKMVNTDGTSVVRNPFALAKGGKLKPRVSLDSGVAAMDGQPQQVAPKKARFSLPPKLIEADSPSQSEPTSQQPAPEPMEVDEVPDDEENAVNGEEEAKAAQTDDETTNDDDADSVEEVQSSEKPRIKVPKPKAKALEDYDLANILVRCNEFVREDKERKKQLASVLRKKKEEKKRQRELEKQQELEAAKTAAANALAVNKDDPNSTNVSTGNDSTEQGEGSLKKKKKRKPKKVNYLLEELGETKKERMEQALQRKLEVIERRKQRKKERQLEKKMQDKENGHGEAANVSTLAASGIGAKLEKLKKKAKTSTKQDKGKPKEPPVRVALSAFAVFHQIPTNQMDLSLAAVAAEDGKHIKSDGSPIAKQQQLKTTNPATITKNNVDPAEKPPTETPSVKKKPTLATKSEETLVEAVDKRDTLSSLQSTVVVDGLPKEVSKMSKKQKKKLALATKSSSNGESELRNEIVEVIAEPFSKVEKPKEKKVKEQVDESDSGTVAKQKKSKQIKQLVAAAEEKLSNAMNEVRAESETVSKVKKANKKLQALQEEKTSVVPLEVVPAKKRKREQQGGGDNSSVASTPRPAKLTKLRVLQRIESGGFFEESVTPDKLRLKRNFGFDERQATPAKQLGFRVSSLLPTGQDELRDMAASSFKKFTKEGRSKPTKFGDVVPTERNATLPLPVWTSSGVFLESAIDGGGDSEKKAKSKPISSAAAESGYIQLKTQGKGDFSLKKLRSGPTAEKPHRVDPTTTAQSVLNFKRQQLLEKTAHLRDKKKSHRM